MNLIPSDIDFEIWYEQMEPVVMLRPVQDIIEQAIDLLKAEPQTPVVMPWLKSRERFSFRPAEVTVYAGQTARVRA